MIFLGWRDEYRVGVSQIDTEHQYLFGLVNEFHDSNAGGDSREEVLRILSRLVAYAEEHFQHEEALMERVGYPRLPRHHELHQKLYSSIFAINEKLTSPTVRVNAETLRFLKDWLVDHVVREDADIGVFMRRKATEEEKAALEQARREIEAKASRAATKTTGSEPDPAAPAS